MQASTHAPALHVVTAPFCQRKGAYPPPPGASPYLGLEAAGHIEQLGPGVEGWKVTQGPSTSADGPQVGAPAMALLSGGGNAEYVCIPALQLLAVPSGLTMEQAAALPEVNISSRSSTRGDTI